MEEAGFDATIVCSNISWQPEGGGLRAPGYRFGSFPCVSLSKTNVSLEPVLS